ncbi:MAG: extracellular solute-binding protein [Pelistega sp.]|nr:extracellular solute-binding protein [Pelistega sp.]
MKLKLAKLAAAGALSLVASLAQAFEGAELYQGEKALYEAAQKEGMVVSFDTGPSWANWNAQFNAFKKRYPGVELVYNDLGSAATVVALDKARNRPQADTAYYFAASALDAVAKDVVTGFEPVNYAKLPENMKDKDAKWFAVHQLNIAFLVNTKLVKDIPQGWDDLLKPEYKGSIVYQDPRSTGQGQVIVFAANFANKGDMDNIKPGIEYLAKLHKTGNVLRNVGTTPYAQFLKGEIPIWIGYENDGLKAKHLDGMGDDIAIVIPKEGSAAAPYAISLVKNGPNPNAGQLWLNFIMTDEGQGRFAEGFVRPSVPGVKLPDSVADKLVDAPQVTTIEIAKATALKPEIDKEWAQAALNQ